MLKISHYRYKHSFSFSYRTQAYINCFRTGRHPSRKHAYIIMTPYFYIVKLGFTEVHIIYLISAQKHRLWVLVRTASLRRF